VTAFRTEAVDETLLTVLKKNSKNFAEQLHGMLILVTYIQMKRFGLLPYQWIAM